MTNEELIIEITAGHNIQDNMYQLYTQNLTLLKNWSSKYISALGEDDVLQECYFALYNAVQGFDVNKGYKFTTYLQSAVKWHFSRIISCKNGIKIGIKDRKLLKEYDALYDEYYKANGSNLTISRAADLLQCSTNDIERILQYKRLQQCSSLESPVSLSDDDMSILDILPSDIDISGDYEESDTQEYLKGIWQQIHNALPEKENEIIKQIFCDDEAICSIAEKSSCTIQNVARIRDQALERLRNNDDFIQWASDCDYDLYSGNGFTAYKHRGCSTIEMITELEERREKRQLKRKERIKQKAIADLEQRFKKLGIDFDFS